MQGFPASKSTLWQINAWYKLTELDLKEINYLLKAGSFGSFRPPSCLIKKFKIDLIWKVIMNDENLQALSLFLTQAPVLHFYRVHLEQKFWECRRHSKQPEVEHLFNIKKRLVLKCKRGTSVWSNKNLLWCMVQVSFFHYMICKWNIFWISRLVLSLF